MLKLSLISSLGSSLFPAHVIYLITVSQNHNTLSLHYQQAGAELYCGVPFPNLLTAQPQKSQCPNLCTCEDEEVKRTKTRWRRTVNKVGTTTDVTIQSKFLYSSLGSSTFSMLPTYTTPILLPWMSVKNSRGD